MDATNEDNFLEGESDPRRRLDFETIRDQLDTNFDSPSTNDLNNVSIDEIHSMVCKEDIPELGKEFNTEEEAYKFYNAYAKKVGFGIRRSKSHADRKIGMILDRIFCCSREGKKVKDKRDATVKNCRAESRCECLAMIKVNCRITGKYRVVEFVAKHNHTVTFPKKTHLHRSHRKISSAQAALANMADSSGIAPKATLELMARERGGRKNLGFIPDDYINYLRTKRTMQMRVGDTCGILEYLQRIVDEDDLITNIFWADARMMADYAHFGDVVCFDTTYRTNKDGMPPIAMFVGVNHHKQSVVFGGALLYDEIDH